MINGRGPKVIWAIDPFAEGRDSQLRMVWTLNSLSETLDATIVPACVVSPDSLRVPESFFAEHLDAIRLIAIDRLESRLKAVKLKVRGEPVVFSCCESSTRSTCHAFFCGAQELRADMIALASHSTLGIPRAVLGGFAETMTQISRTPLLMSTPRTRCDQQIKHILLPLTLSQGFESTIDRAVALCRAMQARLTVLNIAQYSPMSHNLPKQLSRLYEETVSGELTRRHDQLLCVLQKHYGRGVKADIAVGFGQECPEYSILRHASKLENAMIVMADANDDVTLPVIGSVTRKILRRSTLPVLVLRESLSTASSRGAASFPVSNRARLPRGVGHTLVPFLD